MNYRVLSGTFAVLTAVVLFGCLVAGVVAEPAGRFGTVISLFWAAVGALILGGQRARHKQWESTLWGVVVGFSLGAVWTLLAVWLRYDAKVARWVALLPAVLGATVATSALEGFSNGFEAAVLTFLVSAVIYGGILGCAATMDIVDRAVRKGGDDA